MKRDQRRFLPLANQRPQQHGDVPEINMQQVSLRFIQHPLDRANFSGGNLPWPIGNLFEPESSQEMESRFSDDINVAEWKTLLVFYFLLDHQRLYPTE